MVEQMYLDPVAFAQSFENANPDAVRSVISMVEDLIAVGEGKKNDYIKAEKDAVAAKDQAAAAEEEALHQLEGATGLRIAGDKKVSAAENTLGARKGAESTAVTDKNNAIAEFDEADSWMDKEVARVNREKIALEEVIQILGDLPEGRRLLSTFGSLIPMGMIANADKSDPDAVQEVVELVNDLIDAGEAVRVGVTSARDLASDNLEEATKQWKWAVGRTVNAQDALAELQVKVAALATTENEKQTVHDEKDKVLKEAINVEEDATAVRKEQVPILVHEGKQLKEVVGILNGLLPKTNP